MNKFTGLVRRCVEDYRMIVPGDKIAVGVCLCLAVLTFLAYFVALPQLTYKQAVGELSNVYSDEVFATKPNMKCQKWAPKVENSRVSYYCYVAETEGRYYYFDHHTGEYGEVTTGSYSS